ncbi:class GN sortase [Caulobacter endophyticus]|uniref:class GN sortase n=1 Tax=Caulobacter endophyticus TaxID=2172652 RepID=UPI00240F5DEE|nr:class GN sortase [Caulobacter endophyticus]MDG2531238.1 class GN sortase [Caulobacter endophyticus]
MSRLADLLGAARRRLPFLLPALAAGGLGLALCGQGLWINAKAALAQVLLERAFDQSLREGGAPVRPWSWADTWPTARIVFPRQGERVIALDGASGQALAFGPGHVAGTPQAGDRGTAVYAAHRDTHFAVLGKVRPGDPILVERADGKVARFEVVGAKVVRWDASGVDPRAPGRSLALATCWPLEAKARGPMRYVVMAKPVEASLTLSDLDDLKGMTTLTR